MQSKATTVKQYLAELEPDRREALEAVRKVIKANLDPKVVETMQYGMIGYAIPHSVYPDGYHCNPDEPLPFLSLGSQKRHMALYLFCIYGNTDEIARFEKSWARSGKKLDMGKSCLRFKKIEDVELDVIGAMVKRMSAARFIKQYEAVLAGTSAGRKKASSKKAPARKKVSKKVPARKTATKKATPQRRAAKKKATRRK